MSKKRWIAGLLSAVMALSVLAVNPVEVSAKNKYKKGDYITFGSYEQDGDTSNGAEPIEWEILTVKNGKALVISKYILDAKPYNVKGEEITWEKSTLRKWLNKDFYNSAFSGDDKKKIVKTKISNPDNESYGTKGGKTTKDKVFLLSVPEIIKSFEFNTWDKEEKYGYSQALLIEGTAYAMDNGFDTYTLTELDYEYFKPYGYDESCIGQTCGRWWLRSPGHFSNGACYVDSFSTAGWSYCNCCVNDDTVGVRPAVWIKL